MRCVLIVEDEDLQRTAFVKALSKLEECRVVGVATVAAALEVIDTDRPDVIVSDIGLPDRLGYELLGELAKRALVVPIYFVTADARTHRPHVPADVPLMEKPVPLATLRGLVRDALGRVEVPGRGEPEAARLAG